MAISIKHNKHTSPAVRLRVCVVRCAVARRSRVRRSVRVWSSRARASTSSLRSSTTSKATRWPRRRRWEADLRSSDGDKTAKARKVGELVADRAKAAGIPTVVFDRAGNNYAGRVAALADGAREGGLEF